MYGLTSSQTHSLTTVLAYELGWAGEFLWVFVGGGFGVVGGLPGLGHD